MSLSKSLRRLMTEKELSVAQISQQSGVPAKTIYHWLNGQQPRKIEHLFSICDVLNITLDELYGRRTRKNPPQPLPNNVLQDLHAGVYEVILRPMQRSK
ncbi:helix-turn-helix domain-containing protein [Bdellovibrio bacteriovorus]|uniref:helix-turn-helix domain-containing protein n=1 Tax=Bdellovibrio bacteriovorus TaxID=959 RepID=UPI0021D3BF14|nr:helix-turn-helix transcriptional regulator [Bdellovibrio bacteriovorus]UXR63242.1 helix-turn-helix domain-containing protein [Bdellovibrio bacteriovorus]